MPRTPGYRLHAQSGQAYIHLNGKQHLLGVHGSAESHAKYARLLAEWNATSSHTGERNASPATFTIAEMLNAFRKHAQTYHSPEEQNSYKYAMRLLNHLYGDTQAAAFGPKALIALREQMIRPREWVHPVTGENIVHVAWCRTYTNHQVNRLKHIFKWATAEEMLPASVYHGLSAVQGLRRSKTTARESDPVKPAPEAMVAQVINFLPPPVRAMVELEAICGARGGELCIMRGIDIDMGNPACWVYRPATHKTAHHGHSREVPLGPKCQKIIEPFLKPNPQAFLFSPAEAERNRRAELAKARTTPIEMGNRPGTNKSRRPKRPPGERYNRFSYGRAISRACDAAFPPPEALAIGRIKTGPKRTRTETRKEWRTRLGSEKWADLGKWRKDHRFSPHRLRHTAATRLRKMGSLELAGVVLGQKTLAATLIYAEQDQELATRVMGEIG